MRFFFNSDYFSLSEKWEPQRGSFTVKAVSWIRDHVTRLQAFTNHTRSISGRHTPEDFDKSVLIPLNASLRAIYSVACHSDILEQISYWRKLAAREGSITVRQREPLKGERRCVYIDVLAFPFAHAVLDLINCYQQV